MRSLCEQCGLSFKSREELGCHQNTVHSDIKKITFKCAFLNCGKVFKTAYLLKKHSIVHSDLKYKCKECQKTFKDKNYADNHHHLREAKYQCSVCQLKFKTPYDRNRHERTTSCRKLMHGNKFHCPFCDKAFSRFDNKNRHVKKFHSNL